MREKGVTLPIGAIPGAQENRQREMMDEEEYDDMLDEVLSEAVPEEASNGHTDEDEVFFLDGDEEMDGGEGIEGFQLDLGDGEVPLSGRVTLESRDLSSYSDSDMEGMDEDMEEGEEDSSADRLDSYSSDEPARDID